MSSKEARARANREYYRVHKKRILARQKAEYCPIYAALYYQENRERIKSRALARYYRLKAEANEPTT